MEVFRIVQDRARTKDLGGTGAYRFAGRWNSKGVYMLYTASNSSLALLESLAHFDAATFPSRLFILTIRVADAAPIYELPVKDYPRNWTETGLLRNAAIGDKFIADNKFVGLKVKSAVNELEFNYLLNPSFPGFGRMVKLVTATRIAVDGRFLKT